MSTWYNAFWPALKSVITETWPEIPAGQVFNDTNIERRDWTNLLDSQQITGAWCVVTIEVAPASGWGTGVRYSVSPTVYYITPHVQGVTATLVDKIESLVKALLASMADIGTVLPDRMTPSFNASNIVNRSLLEADQAFQAASLTFTSIVAQP